jgi:hypothetical protein
MNARHVLFPPISWESIEDERNGPLRQLMLGIKKEEHEDYMALAYLTIDYNERIIHPFEIISVDSEFSRAQDTEIMLTGMLLSEAKKYFLPNDNFHDGVFGYICDFKSLEETTRDVIRLMDPIGLKEDNTYEIVIAPLVQHIINFVQWKYTR